MPLETRGTSSHQPKEHPVWVGGEGRGRKHCVVVLTMDTPRAGLPDSMGGREKVVFQFFS